MSETMIERVGRALAAQEGYAYAPYPYDERAKAAIEAMREPTLGMMSAGEEIEYLIHGTTTAVEDIWETMIKTALDDPPKSPQ